MKGKKTRICREAEIAAIVAIAYTAGVDTARSEMGAGGEEGPGS